MDNATPCQTCPWCISMRYTPPSKATTMVTTYEGGDPVEVCGFCAREFREWEIEQQRAIDDEVCSYIDGGEHYADTMSGGSIRL